MHFNHNGFATSELSDAFLIFFLFSLLPLCASGLSTPRPCFAQRVFEQSFDSQETGLFGKYNWKVGNPQRLPREILAMTNKTSALMNFRLTDEFQSS